MTILLASDLDGTLLDENYAVDENSVQQIKNFTAAGNVFMIATGRLDHDIEYIEETVGFTGEYRMSQNGAVVKMADGTVLVHHPIPQAAIGKISDFLATLELRVEASTMNNRFFPTPRDPEQVAEYRDSSIILTNFFADIKKLEICTFLIFGDKASFEPIRIFLAEEMSEVVDGFMTSPTSFEIVLKGVNKGQALVEVIKLISQERKFDVTASIGDSENDAPMFPVVDKSFAMHHSETAFKKLATYEATTVGACIEQLLIEEHV